MQWNQWHRCTHPNGECGEAPMVVVVSVVVIRLSLLATHGPTLINIGQFACSFPNFLLTTDLTLEHTWYVLPSSLSPLFSPSTPFDPMREVETEKER
jgi:hypothetical protein